MLSSYLLAAMVSAQMIGAGVKGGITLTSDRDLTKGPQTENSIRVNRATVGPYVEWQPWRQMPSIEAGLLYRRFRGDHYFGPFPNAALNYEVRTTQVWDVPLLLKVRRGEWFAGAGATLRRLGDYDSISRVEPTLGGDRSPVESRSQVVNEDRMRYGWNVTGGYSYRWGVLKFEPELRFTRWTARRQLPTQNQLDFLLGVRF